MRSASGDGGSSPSVSRWLTAPSQREPLKGAPEARIKFAAAGAIPQSAFG
nr:MAG TPA: hypothetical protein [Bacteriophage sp.]